MKHFKVLGNLYLLAVVMMLISCREAIKNIDVKNLEPITTQINDTIVKSESVIIFSKTFAIDGEKFSLELDSVGFPGESDFMKKLKVAKMGRIVYQDSIAGPLCNLSLNGAKYFYEDDDNFRFSYMNGCDGDTTSTLHILQVDDKGVVRVSGNFPYFFENQFEKGDYLKNYVPEILFYSKDESIQEDLILLWKKQSKLLLIDEGIIE